MLLKFATSNLAKEIKCTEFWSGIVHTIINTLYDSIQCRRILLGKIRSCGTRKKFMASRDSSKIPRSAACAAIDAHVARDLPTFSRAHGVRKRRLEQWTAPVIFLNQSRRLTIPPRPRYRKTCRASTQSLLRRFSLNGRSLETHDHDHHKFSI